MHKLHIISDMDETAANKKGFNEALMQAWSKQGITNIIFVSSMSERALLPCIIDMYIDKGGKAHTDGPSRWKTIEYLREKYGIVTDAVITPMDQYIGATGAVWDEHFKPVLAIFEKCNKDELAKFMAAIDAQEHYTGIEEPKIAKLVQAYNKAKDAIQVISTEEKRTEFKEVRENLLSEANKNGQHIHELTEKYEMFRMLVDKTLSSEPNVAHTFLFADDQMRELQSVALIVTGLENAEDVGNRILPAADYKYFPEGSKKQVTLKACTPEESRQAFHSEDVTLITQAVNMARGDLDEIYEKNVAYAKLVAEKAGLEKESKNVMKQLTSSHSHHKLEKQGKEIVLVHTPDEVQKNTEGGKVLKHKVGSLYNKMYSARLNELEKKLEKLDKSTKPSSKKMLREGSSFRKIFTRSESKDDTGKGGRGGQ